MDSPTPMSFSAGQMRAIEIAERTMSVFSLIGSMLIVTTFATIPSFRKPINRLVMYASLGNVLCNIATVISISGMKYGDDSALCQFQGFLIQMFIPADSGWTFCMALNVFLTFFKGYNTSDLRRLEKWYFLACYGIPLLPALIYLILDTTSHTGIYGSAAIWCWVSSRRDWMRIAFFYGPVWIIIVMTMLIYFITGKAIFKQRRALKSFSRRRSSSVPLPVLQNPFTAGGINVMRTTEISVTSESAAPLGGNNMGFRYPRYRTDQDRLGLSEVDVETRSSFSSSLNPSKEGSAPAGYSRGHAQDGMDGQTLSTNALTSNNTDRIHDKEPSTQYSTIVTAGTPLPPISTTTTNPPLQEPKTEATTEPSHITPASTTTPTHPRKRAGTATNQANTAAFGYAKVALLMFTAVVIVWVPSSINRAAALASPVATRPPRFGMNLAAACVLPLQGFWNAVVYFATSRPQTREAWREFRALMRRRVDGMVVPPPRQGRPPPPPPRRMVGTEDALGRMDFLAALEMGDEEEGEEGEEEEEERRIVRDVPPVARRDDGVPRT